MADQGEMHSQNDDKTQTHIVLTKGTMVSHYRIVEKIGAGGMGEVYLAEDTELDRKVALKFLPPHLCQDEDCRRRFRREAQAAAKLSHPNIIHVYEVSEHQGRPFFAMQHIEGRSLRDVKAEELDIDRIIGIAIQLCDGLQSAHAAGVTHRDIKPSNIVIDSSGRPKLLDFGLATVKGGEHLTKTGSTLGTVGYMSPEQIEGKPTDARSDLFSLGVVLYELIANKSPFRRDDEAATLKAILHDEPQPLARYNSSVPDDLQRIITKLLEKDPSLRYQSAEGVIPDLKKLSSGTTSRIATGRKPDRWNRYVVPAAIIVLLAVLGVWYFGYRDQAPAPSEEDGRIMLAVLPFENLGNPEDEYFADGMTEEITARLARVKELGVIARTSIKPYKNTDKTIAQIGQELDVDYILEGTIRWQKSAGTPDRIRVTPQLIRVTDATHVWANVYDEVLSEVFQMQSNIAGQVVNALNITLVDTEQEILGTIPTTSLEAYSFYLQGKDYYDKYKSIEEMWLSVHMFEEAVEIDSTFAGAHAWLARLYSIVQSWVDPVMSDSLRQAAYRHATMAQEFSGDGVDGHFAMGYYYQGIHEHDRALKEFEQALSKQPNNSELIAATAGVLRRQGRWKEALARYEKSARLDPRSVEAKWRLAMTYHHMRRYADALRVIDQGLTLSPDWWAYETLRVWVTMAQCQSVDTALALLDSFAERADAEFVKSFKLDLYFLNRDYAACERLEATVDNAWRGDSAGYFIMRGQICDKLDQRQAANDYYDSAMTVLEGRLEHGSTSAFDYTAFGRACALRGDTARALELRRKGQELLPLSKDALDGAYVLVDVAKIYSLTGESDAAIDILDTLLRIPSPLTLIEVKQDASYDPLRDHPRFQALIEKYEKEYGT